jgi:protein phosphatase
LYVLHAGDSRCYLLRDGELRQLTHDHTVSNQLIEKGGMTAEEASNSRWSNVLYNALGAGAAEVVPDVHKVALQPGDTILLCTDGLYRHVRDNEIRDLLETELEPPDSCRSLIDLANYRGGLDNITAVVARLGTPEDASHPKTRVAAEITLERLLRETTGFQPLAPDTKPEHLDHTRPPEQIALLPDTADFAKKKT